MRVCLDTNVLVSAVATRGLCADLLVVLLAKHDLILGETVLTEVQQVLARKLRVPKDTIKEFDLFLRAQATIIETKPGVPHQALDAADARVLAEAISGGAAVLVTGDAALLALSDAPVEILSPRGLWDSLRSGSRGPRRAT